MLMEADRTQTLVTNIASLQLIEADILEIRINPDVEIERSDVEEIIAIAEQLGNGKKLKHLVLYGMRSLPSLEARVLLCSEFGSRFKLAEAMVVLTLSQRMIFNFMINVEKTACPSRLFTNTDDALDWLKSI